MLVPATGVAFAKELKNKNKRRSFNNEVNPPC